MNWRAFPPRQITGKPFCYFGYIGRNTPEAHCCNPGEHRGAQAAINCARRAAKVRNLPPTQSGIDGYPKEVRACDVAGTDFGPQLYKLKGGTALYDEVYVTDGGNAFYLARIRYDHDPVISLRWIPFDSILIKMYDPSIK